MSIWVELLGKSNRVSCSCHDCGHKHTRIEHEILFKENITANLVKMAKEAGIYDFIWETKEHGIKKAKQLIEPLRKALAEMKADPARFEKHSWLAGRGTYQEFVQLLEQYLAACETHPNAKVRAGS